MVSSDSGEPIRVMFVNTSLPFGGAETQQLALVRRLNRQRFAPEVCCLKARGPLASRLPEDVPIFEKQLKGKFDVSVIWRLRNLFRARGIQAVVIYGAGDKMFWGRIAARLARVPVVVSSLHCTGWPDAVGRLNRLLTPLTDAFVGVARSHGRFLIEHERFPADRVKVIPNGVDTERFRPLPGRAEIRHELGLAADTPLVGIVARLSYEKNHRLFLDVASRVRRAVPDTHFLIVGEGPLQAELESQAKILGLAPCVHFLGVRHDIPEILAELNVFTLASRMEASPMSILEALSCETPVVATRVGSVPDTILHEETGFLVASEDAEAMTEYIVRLLGDAELSKRIGTAGRTHVVRNNSLELMVAGYEKLIADLLAKKSASTASRRTPLRWRSKSAMPTAGS